MKKAEKKVARKPKEIIKLFVKSMKAIARELDKNPSDITPSQFWSKDEEDIPEWEIRRVGGFTNLKGLYFPKEAEQEAAAIVVKRTGDLLKDRVKKVQDDLGTRKMIADELAANLKYIVADMEFKLHKPLVKQKKSAKKAERTIIAHLSDTHYGCNIDKSEMGGLNEYNWQIAARRTALFFQQIVNYKPQHRDQTEVVLLVNGDIIAGMIHNQEWFVDLLTTQFAGTLNILCQGISYLAQNFKKVRVVMTPGNHGRSMHKADQGRGTTHKWDSYETQIFIAVRQVMLAKCPNVEVDIPDSPFAIVKAQGHHYFVTHSDTVINVGNPGAALNMKSINNQINKLNASELGGSAKFDAVICGHIHVATMQLMESGCMSIFNGCLSGLDPYALSIGIFDSNPTQQLFEATEKHAVGDVRFIQVKSADNDASLDKIIETPKRPY
jgi:hypothetical protein